MSFGGKNKKYNDPVFGSNLEEKEMKRIMGHYTRNDFTSPQGRVKTRGNATTFTPNQSLDQKKTQMTTDRRLNSLVAGIPTSMDVDSLYNNPFYGSTRRMLTDPIYSQFDRDNKDLRNDLNARNLMGGSFDAYQNSLLRDERNRQLTSADDQARGVSADAYQQQYSNILAGLAGLRNDRSAAFDQMYAPAKLAMGFQSNLASPLATAGGLAGGSQQGAASFQAAQAGRPNPLLSFLSQTAGSVAKAYTGMPG